MAKGKKTGGRKAGTPNRATANARDAIAMLVNSNAGRMQEWLDQIAETEGPRAAWGCMTDVIEYHIPKLSRAEVTGDGGKPIEVSIVRYTPPA